MIRKNRYIETTPQGQVVGKNPRRLTVADVRDLNHPLQPIYAIRQKCLQCAGSAAEADACIDLECPLWLFRFGHVPCYWKRVKA